MLTADHKAVIDKIKVLSIGERVEIVCVQASVIRELANYVAKNHDRKFELSNHLNTSFVTRIK